MMNNRIVFLDYVRIIACFLVMIVHASENFYPGPGATDMAGPVSLLVSETDRLWVSIYDGFSRMSVPLFIIVSAYLLVPMKEGQTTLSFYRKRFTRVIPPMMAFIILYSTLPLLWDQIDLDTSSRDLSHMLLNFPTLAGHLWFMYPLIGLYLFIPVISPWIRKVSAREERFFIGLFLISTCIPFLNHWIGEVWGQCFWNEYHMLWYFSGYLGYLVLAHYIRVHLDWSRTRRFYSGLALMLAGAAVTILSFYVQAIPGQIIETPTLEIGWSFCTINVVMLSAGAFLMLTCIETQKEPAMVADCSRLSFGMYLVHIFWLGMWVTVFKTDMAMPSYAAIPAIAVATFISCFVTMKVLSPLPWSNWTLGIDKPRIPQDIKVSN